MRRMQAHFEACSQALELSLPQAMALRNLDQPRPMRELVGHLGCNASYVTGIADNLEQRGLIERRSDPGDRRVKQLVLTPKGLALRQQLGACLLEDHPIEHSLSPDDQHILRDLLRRAVDFRM
ncbi:MAG TPA: MarR family transcriptional regulator [Herpetosiphonaceae bacterium]|nr:MarR family transcriptional regulator [Herpetosiphonaceae bacterium]